MSAPFIEFLGAAALLLWGLRMVSTGVTRAFGMHLRGVMRTAASKRHTAFLSGFIAALATQSATAVNLIAAAFAGKGAVSVAMALAMALGADLGTSFLAQLFNTDFGWFSAALVTFGVVIYMASDHDTVHAVGRSFIGLGLVLLAIRMLRGAITPMATSPLALSLLDALGQVPVLAFALAAVFTLLMSSSLAMVILVQSVGMTAGLAPQAVVALVLGANLGVSVVPWLINFRAEPAARQVALGNLVFRGAGAVLLLPFAADAAAAVLRLTGNPAHLAVDLHLLYNFALALIFLPLTGLAASLAARLSPGAAPGPAAPRYLDDSALGSPPLALAAASREALRMADSVEEMLQALLGELKGNDLRASPAIALREAEVDGLLGAIKTYVARLGRENALTDAEAARAGEVLDFAINLEHAGDIISGNLSALVAKKVRGQLSFSAAGAAEILTFFHRTLDCLHLSQSLFHTRDTTLARQLVELKDQVRAFERESSGHHIERLREGLSESLETSSLHLDMLRDLKRINAHLTAVAHPILEGRGELSASRLTRPTRPTLVRGGKPGRDG